MAQDVLQRPEPFHAGLIGVVAGIGGVEGREDAEQGGILGLEGGGQRRRGAVPDGGDELPLVDQVDIAPQRRGAPGIAGHADAGVGQGLGAHAHLDARGQGGLAAVDARHAVVGQQPAPVVVHQDHGLGDDQVERCAALAHGDAHLLLAGGGGVLEGIVAQQAEGVVGAVEVLGLAAHHLAAGLERLCEPPQEPQGGAVALQVGAFGGRVGRSGQPFGRDQRVEHVEPQVVGNRHALHLAAGVEQGQGGFVVGGVERQGRAGLSLAERVVAHHLVGQHGDLVARHVDGGEPVAGHVVDGVAGLHGQAGRRDVHAQRDAAGAESGHGQGIVDLGGAGVVDREGLHVGERQPGVVDPGRGQRREAGAVREELEQEALPVELVGRRNGARALQQLQGRELGLASGLHHGLVFGGVLVGAEQDAVELLAHRGRSGAGHQLGSPVVDLGLDARLLLDGGKGLLHDLGRRLAEAALGPSGATEVVRCLEQREQRGRLLHGGGRVLEVFARDVDEAEFLLVGGEFPQQLHIHLARHGTGLGEQGGRGGLVEREHDVGRLGLDALAAVELDLGAGVGLGEDAAGVVFAGVFEQCKHGAVLSHVWCGGRAIRLPAGGPDPGGSSCGPQCRACGVRSG